MTSDWRWLQTFPEFDKEVIEMNGHHRLVTTVAVAIGLMAMTAIGVAGSQGVPGPPGYHDQTPRMSREETQSVMESYLQELVSNGSYADFFAEDIVVTLMDVDEVVRGRDAAHEAVKYLHEIAFDAGPALQTIVYGEGIASAELVFVGTQIGEFAGVGPTEGEIRVPYSVVWELTDGKITNLRLYQLATGLTTQVTALASKSTS